MATIVKSISVVIGAAAVSVPIALVATIALFPFWSWIEDTFGVESVGHSGPANWCFVFTYAVVFAALLALWRWLAMHRVPSASPN